MRPAKRLLAIIRLSKDRDTTNSPPTQREDIADYTLTSGDSIVAWIEEIDVSGGIPMRERPQAGPWLAEDRLDEWDGIIGSRLDRLFRSQLDYLLWVRDFCDAQDKLIIDVEGGIDTSTPQGRRELNNRAQVADYERQRISENRGKAQKRVRRDARYGGGPIPFGYTKKRLANGWELVPHPEYSVVLQEVVDRVIAGESANSVCMDLNARGVPTSFDAQRIISGRAPRGGKWQTNQMLRMLRSPALKGVVMHYVKKGAKWELPTPLVGRDGMPVRRAELIDDDTWDDLQARIGTPQDRSHYRANAATLLLGVAVCGECGGAMHSERKTGRDREKQRRYYGCQNRHYKSCTARLVPMETLDEYVNEMVLAIGDEPETETKPGKRGNNRERRLKDIGEAIVNLTQERYVENFIRPDFDAIMASLQQERERVQLEQEPEPEPVKIPTGKTIAQAWSERDTEGKRRWLLKRRVKIKARRLEDGTLQAWWSEGGELIEDIEPLGYPMRDEWKWYTELPEKLGIPRTP